MRAASILSLVLFVSACSKKKDDAPLSADPKPAAGAATAPANGTPAGATTPGTTAAAPSATKLTCDKIFPKELRDKYFAGWEIADNPQPVDIAGECKITKGDEQGVVSATCHANVAAAMQASIDGIKQNMKEAKDLPGVGKAAVIIDMGKVADKQMPIQVTAWDDDSNCSTHISAPGGVDAVALAKDMIAALPPK